jgi:hypothetical protein
MTSTHEAELDLPVLNAQARHVHVVPGLNGCSLMSIARLCDSGYQVIFDKEQMRVLLAEQCILTGTRDPSNNLWKISLHEQNVPPKDTTHEAAAAIGSPTTADMVAFAHATLFSPALSTLEKALNKGYLTNFPGLTPTNLKRYPPQSLPMSKGHMDQGRKNQQSTKQQQPVAIQPDADDPEILGRQSDQSPEGIETRTHQCFATVMETTNQIHSDQTGRFIVPSSTGNNYMMVVYDYDSNHIFVAPFKNRTAKCLLATYQQLHTRLCRAGLKPRLQRLDNECSEILKDFMHSKDIDYQLVPPGVHRRNAAERAIRTWQNHFIAGLCSVDKNFPLHLWDQLVPQAEISLNLLRGSRLNPKLSSWAQVNGQFDYNRTPLGPPGCRVIGHAKTEQRTSWSPHGLDGWYTGPALESYRCYEIWIWETRAIRICDTVKWFPSKVNMPKSSTEDLILTSLQDIAAALQKPAPRSPLSPTTPSHKHALDQLVEVLTNVVRDATLADSLRVAKPEDTSPRVPSATTPPATQQQQEERMTPTDPVLIPDVIDDEEPPPALLSKPTADLIPDDDNDDIPLPTKPSPSSESAAERTNVPQMTTKQPETSTYDNSTGPTGKARRRTQRQTKATKTKPKPKTTPAHPRTRRRKAARRKAADKSAEHQHGTRSRSMLASTAAPTHHVAMHGTAMNPDTGKVAEYKELSQCSTGTQWAEALGEEVGRLFQGLGPTSSMPTGTNTMFFIDKKNIPIHKKPTYIRVVCADRPEKPQPRRVRWTMGGDRIVYTGDVSTKTADLTTVKCLFNSVISTPNGKFMTADLKDFYLESELDEYEYARIPVSMLPAHILDLYNLHDKVDNDFVYAEVRKGMYGLPQAGKLAYDRLQAYLAPLGYVPCQHTHGLWRDVNSDVIFSLVVDDFGVRYTKMEDAQKLMTALKASYRVAEDWAGERYIGLTINWNYAQRTCTISMPGYIERALQRFSHPTPTRPQDSPHPWTAPQFGAHQQFATQDLTPILDVKDTKHIQEVLGTLLYYARAVDCTMLAAIGTLAGQQAQATKQTMIGITQLLNYCATHPTASIEYRASDMCLHVESDASYLSEPKGRSRAAGYHYLSSRPSNPQQPPAPGDPPPMHNGPIDIFCKVMQEVLSSAAEAEFGTLFHNGKTATQHRTVLEELGHPQPPTPIVTDNSTASGIANDTVKQKRSKAMDMRFYWIRDRVRQGQFIVYWKAGKTNKADYFTKHHATKHHREVRYNYLKKPEQEKTKQANYYDCLQEAAKTPTNTILKSALRTTRSYSQTVLPLRVKT